MGKEIAQIEVVKYSKGVNTGNFKVAVEEEPNECPYCHKSINPHFIGAYCPQDEEDYVSAIYQCPSSECQEFFISIYENLGFHTTFGATYELTDIIGGLYDEFIFNDEIKKISPKFVKIFNQAYQAEIDKLTEICGMGYRKAIEYLLKDYAIKKNPLEKGNIPKMHLPDVIKKYIDEPNMRDMANRAVWLANDETHYLREWEDFTLKDVKMLIQLTIRWIEVEILTGKYKNGIQRK